MKRKLRKHGFCSLGCGTARTTIKPGPCGPCKSWLWRIAQLSDHQLLAYARELGVRLRRSEARYRSHPLGRSFTAARRRA